MRKYNLLFIILFIYCSCDEPKDDIENSVPLLEIISPTNGQKISLIDAIDFRNKIENTGDKTLLDTAIKQPSNGTVTVKKIRYRKPQNNILYITEEGNLVRSVSENSSASDLRYGIPICDITLLGYNHQTLIKPIDSAKKTVSQISEIAEIETTIGEKVPDPITLELGRLEADRFVDTFNGHDKADTSNVD